MSKSEVRTVKASKKCACSYVNLVGSCSFTLPNFGTRVLSQGQTRESALLSRLQRNQVRKWTKMENTSAVPSILPSVCSANLSKASQSPKTSKIQSIRKHPQTMCHGSWRCKFSATLRNPSRMQVSYQCTQTWRTKASSMDKPKEVS